MAARELLQDVDELTDERLAFDADQEMLEFVLR